MKPSRVLSFRRSHLRDPVLRDEASAAAMEEEGARVRAQKAAAWQWLMRGGTPAEPPFPEEPSVRGPPPPVASSSSRPPSRFAHEAALLPHLPLLDNVDLASLAVSDSAARLYSQKLDQEKASCISAYAFEKEARIVQSSERRGLHLHFRGFQKLFRKLMPSPSGRNSMASPPATIRSDSDEEAQHHYHGYVYHHHHHHHHYYYGAAGFPTCLAEQPHPSTARRRRHSESGLYRLAQQYHLCAESEAGTPQTEEEDQQNELSKLEQRFLPTFSNHARPPRHPMKSIPGDEAAVKRQTINDFLSMPIERTVSERFADTANSLQFSDEDDETPIHVARCNNKNRRPFRLQDRIIFVDA